MARLRSAAVGILVLGTAALVGAGLPSGSRSAEAAATWSSRPASAVPPPRGAPEFSATFPGTQLNTKVWDTCYPFGRQTGCTNFGNKEYEWYVPSQVRVGGGYLRLTASRIPVMGTTGNGTPKKYYCRSGMVTSYPGIKFEYGFVQVVANIPHAPGLWPALWLAAASLKWPPEMDMIETWGVSHEEASFFHPVGAQWSKGSVPLSLTKGWQTYSLRWTSTKITFYVGSRIVLTVTKNVPHQPMYLTANLAEYVSPATGNCTGTMLIKSVKVWK